jgi:hypothetical protein
MTNNSDSHMDDLKKLQMEYERVRTTTIRRTAFTGTIAFIAVGVIIISGFFLSYSYYNNARSVIAALQEQEASARQQLAQAQGQIAQLQTAILNAQNASSELQKVAGAFGSLKEGLETWHPTISQGNEVKALIGGPLSQCPSGTYATGIQTLSSEGGPHGIIYGLQLVCRSLNITNTP